MRQFLITLVLGTMMMAFLSRTAMVTPETIATEIVKDVVAITRSILSYAA